MSSETYTLFDIPTKDPQRCWSMNAWRARILFNYKGLDYKTEWVEYPDIKPRLEGHVPPNPTGTQFTIPAIQFPSGAYAMESYHIADLIDEAHPSPPLVVKGPLLDKFRPMMMDFMTALRPVYVPGVPQRLLGEKSRPYFEETRARDVGMPVKEYGEKHGEGSIEKAGEPMKRITALLNETEGPLFLGEEVSYVDIIWAGILIFFKMIGEEEFEGLLKVSGDGDAQRRFLEKVKPWLERDT